MYYLIVNPTAGRGRAIKLLPEVEAYFSSQRLSLKRFITTAPKEASHLVKELPEDAKVLSLGGDGTLHEIALSCIGSQRTLGIIPAGSGDDFAFALGIPRNNLTEALTICTASEVRLVDTGVSNGIPFINAHGVGFDADVAHNIRQAPSFLKDRWAYIYAVLRTLFGLHLTELSVTIDGELFYQGKSLLTTVQNGPRGGGSFLFAPRAKVDDGLADIVIAGHIGHLGVLGLLPQVMKGKHLTHPQVYYQRGKNLTMTWQSPRVGHCEGELMAATKTFTITIKPRSLRVLAPS